MEKKEHLTPGDAKQHDEIPLEERQDAAKPSSESTLSEPQSANQVEENLKNEQPRDVLPVENKALLEDPEKLSEKEAGEEETETTGLKDATDKHKNDEKGLDVDDHADADDNVKVYENSDENPEEEVVKKEEETVNEEDAAREEVIKEEDVAKEEEVIKEEDAAKEEEAVKEEDAAKEEEEDDDEDSDEGEELSERYTKLSREELVGVLEALVKEEDVNQIRAHIGYIKIAFRKLLKEENEANYENRLKKDNEQEDSAEVHLDVLSERFDRALDVYREKKSIYDQAIEQQKVENLALKEKILEDLRNLIESEEELKKTYDQFRELQEQWRDIGAVPQGSKSTLWNNYHFLVEKFFDKVKINKELKDLDLKKNLEAKTELCEKAEELLLETSITRSFQQLQKFHEAWKETGPVPKDKKDEIWERFKSATEKLNKRRQEYYDNLREDQNKNYAAKLILCEKAEELAAANPESPKQWQAVTDQINELFKMWKTIGFAPKKVNNEVWNRFRSSLDTFYRYKKEYFLKYKEHQTENYNQKLNLCLQAEALRDNQDWRNTTEELISLQKQWKKIGPVPAKFSDKIWKRFRAACDEFFSKKADHFSNIGEKQEENLKKKVELISRLKDYPYTSDNANNLKVLKDFQREWMDIGHVPIKQKDKIQNEFRKTIDEQFEKLNISKKAKSTLNYRSKLENIKSAPNADNLLYKERNFIINKISAIQSDIKIWENNIGFFASSKKADILKAEFEEKIEKGRQEIVMLEEKLKILRES